MTDLRMRSLSRLSASGDLHAQARLLVERLRVADPCRECGGKGHTTPTSGPKAGRKDYTATCEACAGFRSVARARVALAAVCGHLPAYEAIEPFTHRGHWDQPIAEWLPVLGRWSTFYVPVRAALAASKVNTERVCRSLRGSGLMHFSPVFRTEGAVEEFLADPTEARWETWRSAWIASERIHGAWDWLPGPTPGRNTIGACAAGSGEPAIRTAIQQALVSWSLGP